MKLLALLRSRLALRIYLVGVVQVAVVAVGLLAIVRANRPTPAPVVDEQARALAQRIEARSGDPAFIAAELGRLHDDEGFDVAIVDLERRPYAATDGASELRCPNPMRWGPGRPPRPPPPRSAGPRGGAWCTAVPVALPTGDGELHMLGRPPPSPPSLAPQVIPLVLIVVGLSSLLLAWSLTRPLAKLSSAAKALGRGELGARVRLARSDELGQLSVAFDEMAGRISELLRSEKELIANVSHELRTPLARIRVALDLAAEGNAEVAQEALADIRGDLDELERLLSDVLMAARLDLAESGPSGGLPPLRREQVDVEALVTAAEERFRSSHPERLLEVDVGPELPTLHADPVLLRRVVDNLLENAHRYCEDMASPIRLEARAERGINIEVIDRGAGIDPEDLPRVFSPFFRAERSRARATGGLGLGLTLVKRIVEAHGGEVHIESRPGQTRVVVTLPTS